MESATTTDDSDFGVAAFCVSESCASFEFVDDDDHHDEDDETTEQDRSIPSYPPKVYDQEAATAAPTSAVCSITGTSEIGSVFGLRFDPQENKMTLQLTAGPNDLPSSRSPAYRKVVEVSNHQPSRYTFYSLNRFRAH